MRRWGHRDGIYRLDPRGFAAVRSYFDNFWGDALEAFKAKVEEE